MVPFGSSGGVQEFVRGSMQSESRALHLTASAWASYSISNSAVRINWNYRRVSWITIAFLLCCGDVEANPGPEDSFECPICNLDVYDDGGDVGALCCDLCNKWVHADCAGVSSEDFDVLAVSDQTVEWFCPTCIFSELPFSEPSADTSVKYQPHLNCRSLNARSIVNKQLDLNALLCANKLDVLAISETFLSPDIFDHECVHSNSYTVFRRDRNRHGGGVMLIVNSSISATRRQDLETDCEILWVELCLQNRKVLFAVSYRPPNSSSSCLLQLEHSLASVPDSVSVVLCGDFYLPNVNWQSPSYSVLSVHMQYS